MSIKKCTIEQNFFTRLALLIKELGYGNRQQYKFADKISISATYLSGILKRKKNPSFGMIYAIANNFPNVNIECLLTGKGEMFHKESKLWAGGIQESVSIYNKVGMPLEDDPVVAELLECARRILKSGNQVAFDALERNIRYFAHAVEMEKRMTTMESDLAAIKEKQAHWEKDCSDKVPPDAEATAIKKAT